MVDSSLKSNILERVEDFYFVLIGTYEDVVKVRKEVNLQLPNKNDHYLLIGSEEEKENVNDGQVSVINKKSINLFGKWKDPKEFFSLQSNKEKVVVHFYTERNNLVNKLVKTFQHATHIGYSNQILTNFDISFRVESEDEKELLAQTVKYLKQL